MFFIDEDIIPIATQDIARYEGLVVCFVITGHYKSIKLVLKMCPISYVSM